MKLSLAIAFVLVASTVTTRADVPADVPADETTVADELGELGGEPAPLPPAAESPPEETPPPKPRARMSTIPGRTFDGRPRGRINDDGEGRLEKTEDTVLGGRHWRIKTAQGAVHVWVPPGYDRATAGTVVYVHGYWTDADGAWKEHELARQFKMSRQNAMFIVPDAPANMDESVHWRALTDLRRAVTRGNIRMPDGPVVVMGHSGAFRTVMQWVDHRMVDQIILLDAMYGGEAKFDEFIRSGKRADSHKMIVVGASVAQESTAFVKKYKFAKAREKVPEYMSGFTKEERRAKLLYIHSQYGHMPIVTNKKVIPLLLKVTRLKALY